MVSSRGQRLIGLTGGIASGKSTVAEYLQQRFCLPLFDADIYARQGVTPESPILTAIARRYGQVILHGDGSLDRSALGEIIFNNPGEKQWLEGQIHPYVKACFQRELGRLGPGQGAVLVIPLLFEAQLTDWVTEIWVVTCTKRQQRERLRERNGLTAAQAQARIDSQMPLALKVARADVVLDNSRSRQYLQSQIDQAWLVGVKAPGP